MSVVRSEVRQTKHGNDGFTFLTHPTRLFGRVIRQMNRPKNWIVSLTPHRHGSQ